MPACSTEARHTLLATVATLNVLTAQMDMLSVYGCLSGRGNAGLAMQASAVSSQQAH